MSTSVYIGNLDDSTFDWDDKSGQSLNPIKRSPFFPGSSYTWCNVVDYFKTNEFISEQRDWGSYVAKMNKDQIEKMIQEVYKNNWYLYLDELFELQQFIKKLDPKKEYAVIASEL